MVVITRASDIAFLRIYIYIVIYGKLFEGQYTLMDSLVKHNMPYSSNLILNSSIVLVINIFMTTGQTEGPRGNHMSNCKI